MRASLHPLGLQLAFESVNRTPFIDIGRVRNNSIRKNDLPWGVLAPFPFFTTIANSCASPSVFWIRQPNLVNPITDLYPAPPAHSITTKIRYPILSTDFSGWFRSSFPLVEAQPTSNAHFPLTLFLRFFDLTLSTYLTKLSLPSAKLLGSSGLLLISLAPCGQPGP